MILVPTKDIHLIEDYIKPLLVESSENVISHNYETADDCLYKLKKGSFLLFSTIPIEFIVVVFIEIKENTKRLYVSKIAGNNYRKHVKDAMLTIEFFAKTIGCSDIIVYARLGTTKDLFRFGFEEIIYKKKHIQVIKAIGDSTQVFAQGEDAFSAEPRSNS
jgi:hypothetical protein